MNASPTHPTNSVTRRRILGWSGAGLLAGVTGYLAWPKPPSPASHPTSGATKQSAAANTADAAGQSPEVLIGRDAFLPLLKSEFQIESPDRFLSTVCRLVEVSAEVSLASPNARYTSYSLLFSAPKEFAAESRIYRVTHPELEPLDLFLSPVGRSEELVHLEAVYTQQV